MHKQTIIIDEYKGVTFWATEEGGHDHPSEIWYWGEVFISSQQVEDEFARKSIFTRPKIQTVSYSGRRFPTWDFPGWTLNLPRRLSNYIVKHAFGTPRDEFVTAVLTWDYQHLFDEYAFYNLDDIVRDCKRAIDTIKQLFPIAIRCTYCSQFGYLETEEWVEPGFGGWTQIHKACNDKRIAELAERGLDQFAQPVKKGVKQ